MSLPVLITPEAERDLARALEWHDKVRAGLGAQFELRFEEALDHIARYPLAQPAVYREARRVLLAQFKYHVYYVIHLNRIYIGAIIHASRHPRVWKRRLRGED